MSVVHKSENKVRVEFYIVLLAEFYYSWKLFNI